MPIESTILIIFIIIALIFAGLYYLNRWAAKKTSTQQELVEKNKQQATIYVIDKKKDYAKNINLPKTVKDNLPKVYKFMKMHFVQAKIGPQVMTLMCDKKVFNSIVVKKNIKVELAGIYIVSVVGMKSEQQIKQMKKDKKQAQKELAQKKSSGNFFTKLFKK